MAALSGTCVRQSLRYMGKSIISTQISHQTCYRRTLQTPCIQRTAFLRPFSCSAVLWNEDKHAADSPGGSTMPLAAMLREAEEKAKRETADDKRRKEERKKRVAQIQKWAMRITGGMVIGASLLSIYELGTVLRSNTNHR